MSEFDDLLLDDFNPDPELNLDLGEMPEEEIKNDRNPSTDIYKGFKSGMGNNFKNHSAINELIERSLPKEYGEVKKDIDEGLTEVSNLYNKIAQSSVKEQLRGIAGSLNYFVPNYFSKTKDLLEDFSKGDKTSMHGSYVRDENIEENTIKDVLGSIFDKKEEEVKQQKTVEDTKVALDLNDQITRKKSSMQELNILNEINNSINKSTQFTEKITGAYYKKDLELQFRQYFVQSELLKTTSQYFEVFKTQNLAIAKNTSLPEYTKITNLERIKDTGLDRISDRVLDSSPIKAIVGRFSRAGQEVMNGITDSLEMISSAGDMYVENVKMEEEMESMFDEGGNSGEEKKTANGFRTAGDLAATFLFSKIKKFIYDDKLKEFLDTDKINEYGATAYNYIKDPSAIANSVEDRANKYREKFEKEEKEKEEADPNYIPRDIEDSIIYKAIMGSADIIKEPITGSGEVIKDTKLGSSFNNEEQVRLKNLSITEIIPGYLSRILREVSIFRTKEDTDLLLFDQTTSRFKPSSSIKDILKTKIEENSNSYSFASSLNSVKDSLLKEKDTLTDEENSTVNDFFIKYSKTNTGYNKDSILKSDLFNEFKDKDLISGLLNNLEGSADKKKFLDSLVSTKRNRPKINELLSSLINEGYGEILEDLGIVKQEKDGNYKLNKEAEEDLILKKINSLDSKYRSHKDPTEESSKDDTTVTSDINTKEKIKKVNTNDVLEAIANKDFTKGGPTVKSDKNVKEDITKTNTSSALDAVNKTPIYNWDYKEGEGDGKEHIGPMAQDLHKNTGEGVAPGKTSIDMISMNGLNMGAIQELSGKVGALEDFLKLKEATLEYRQSKGDKEEKDALWDKILKYQELDRVRIDNFLKEKQITKVTLVNEHGKPINTEIKNIVPEIYTGAKVNKKVVGKGPVIVDQYNKPIDSKEDLSNSAKSSFINKITGKDKRTYSQVRDASGKKIEGTGTLHSLVENIDINISKMSNSLLFTNVEFLNEMTESMKLKSLGLAGSVVSLLKTVAGGVIGGGKSVLGAGYKGLGLLFKGGKSVLGTGYRGLENLFSKFGKKETDEKEEEEEKSTNSLLSNALQYMYDAGKSLASKTFHGTAGLIKGIFKAGKWIRSYVESVDMYLPDSDTPIIRSNLMSEGYYIDQVTGKVIKSISDIKGTIVNAAGDVIVTAKEIERGLLDKNGNKIKSISIKIFDGLKNNFNRNLRRLKSVGKFALKSAKVVGGAALTPFKYAFNKIFGKSSETSKLNKDKGDIKGYDILKDIRDILLSRLKPLSNNDPFIGKKFKDKYTDSGIVDEKGEPIESGAGNSRASMTAKSIYEWVTGSKEKIVKKPTVVDDKGKPVKDAVGDVNKYTYSGVGDLASKFVNTISGRSGEDKKSSKIKEAIDKLTKTANKKTNESVIVDEKGEPIKKDDNTIPTVGGVVSMLSGILRSAMIHAGETKNKVDNLMSKSSKKKNKKESTESVGGIGNKESSKSKGIFGAIAGMFRGNKDYEEGHVGDDGVGSDGVENNSAQDRLNKEAEREKAREEEKKRELNRGKKNKQGNGKGGNGDDDDDDLGIGSAIMGYLGLKTGFSGLKKLSKWAGDLFSGGKNKVKGPSGKGGKSFFSEMFNSGKKVIKKQTPSKVSSFIAKHGVKLALGGLAGSAAIAAAAPVVLTAAAIWTGWEIGSSIYEIGEELVDVIKETNLSKDDAIRYSQYGLNTNNEFKDLREPIYDLEIYMSGNQRGWGASNNWVSGSNHFKKKVESEKGTGLVKPILKNIDMNIIYEIFDLGEEEEDLVMKQRVNEWFSKRFLFFYCRHLTALRHAHMKSIGNGSDNIELKNSLSDLSDEELIDYYTTLKRPNWIDGPYERLTSPFKKLPEVLNTKKITISFIDQRLKELGADKTDKKLSKAHAIVKKIGGSVTPFKDGAIDFDKLTKEEVKPKSTMRSRFRDKFRRELEETITYGVDNYVESYIGPIPTDTLGTNKMFLYSDARDELAGLYINSRSKGKLDYLISSKPALIAFRYLAADYSYDADQNLNKNRMPPKIDTTTKNTDTNKTARMDNDDYVNDALIRLDKDQKREDDIFRNKAKNKKQTILDLQAKKTKPKKYDTFSSGSKTRGNPFLEELKEENKINSTSDKTKEYTPPKSVENKLKGANPSLITNALNMFSDHHSMTNKKIGINSGYRSTAEQERLYKKDPSKAAVPGRSLHEHGLAIDVNNADVNKLEKSGLMQKHGFTRPVKNEPWHIEPIGLRDNLTTAKTDPNYASAVIDDSLGKGGGGIGSNFKGSLGAPNDEFKKLFNKPTPEDNVVKDKLDAINNVKIQTEDDIVKDQLDKINNVNPVSFKRDDISKDKVIKDNGKNLDKKITELKKLENENLKFKTEYMSPHKITKEKGPTLNLDNLNKHVSSIDAVLHNSLNVQKEILEIMKAKENNKDNNSFSAKAPQLKIDNKQNITPTTDLSYGG